MSHSSSHRTEWAGRVEEDGVSSRLDNLGRRIKSERDLELVAGRMKKDMGGFGMKGVEGWKGYPHNRK